ncbi:MULTISPECIES: glycosyltransferase [unclassified Sphingobacterium]|uniref:glycosyltransferase n=1 Tax=unclassified Sphingobacterium TaxID=2609468 RepID=UPI0025E9EFDF|nr:MULTISPECIES: glycosyltransferase [unclassified Sphingobacterium]
MQKDNIAICIVLYNCKLEDSKTYKTLTASVYESGGAYILYVYDNSAVRQSLPANMKAWCKICYIHDPTNPGVSKAYNECSRLAKDEGARWIILTDQDTDFPSNTLRKYAEALNDHPTIKLFAPILLSGNVPFSPSNYFLKRGVIWKRARPGIWKLKGKTILNSGVMINIESFFVSGGYNESIRLYFSDFEFLDRFKRIYEYFFVMNIYCYHQLSDIVEVDVKNAKRRFKFYCEGSYLSAHTKLDYCAYFVTVGARACKLSVKYRTFEFCKIFARNYLGTK